MAARVRRGSHRSAAKVHRGCDLPRLGRSEQREQRHAWELVRQRPELSLSWSDSQGHVTKGGLNPHAARMSHASVSSRETTK